MNNLFNHIYKQIKHLKFNFFVVISIVLIFSINEIKVAAQCPEYMRIKLRTQAAVDSFSINYPSCSEPIGIEIGPSADIVDLTPLQNFTMKFGFFIEGNQLLKNLKGLEKFDSINTIVISNNLALNDISVIEKINLYYVGGSPRMTISNNPSLSTCCFFASPQFACASIGRLYDNGPGCKSMEQVFTTCTQLTNYSCSLPNRGFINDTLQANNVKALINSNGGLFFDYVGVGTYVVPNKPDKANVSSLFVANLWMGGIDEEGDLRVAAQTYNQSGLTFWPGPIVENYAHCNEFDRVWTVSKASVDTFLNNYIETQGEIAKSAIPQSILKYPATNNPHFDEFPLPQNESLAPYVDTNKDGKYNPIDGDYPAIKGDQNNWNIFNDARFYGRVQSCNYPLNMQIDCMAYASASNDYINNATFYDYTLTYKGNDTLTDFYLGMFVDPDLGNYLDDFVGCDIDAKMGYAYNGDDFDDGPEGYGDKIPAIGIKFVKSLINENNEEVDLAAFVYYQNNFTEIGNPLNSKDTYNYLKGFWKDDTPLTPGGNGYGGDTPYPFMYSNPPKDENGWSEYTAGNEPGDRRFVMSVGPITLSPGEVQTVTIGILWEPNVDLDGNGLGNPTEKKYACDQPNGYVATMDSLATNIQTNSITKLSIIPNPASHFINVSFGKMQAKFHKMKIYNSLGQVVYQNEIPDNKKQVRIDVSAYKNGIYFIKVSDNSNNSNQTSFIVH